MQGGDSAFGSLQPGFDRRMESAALPERRRWIVIMKQRTRGIETAPGGTHASSLREQPQPNRRWRVSTGNGIFPAGFRHAIASGLHDDPRRGIE